MERRLLARRCLAPLRHVAWLPVVLAWAGALVGWVGPHVGGGAGLEGVPGFVVEVVTAMWLPGGALAALVLAVLAACGRRRAALVLAPVALAMLVPELWAAASAPAARLVADGPVLRVATANLEEGNEDDPDTASSLRALDADVLVLVEFTPRWGERLEREFAGDYPHRWLAAPPPEPDLPQDGLRIAVWSRLPATGSPEVRCLRGRNAQIRVPIAWQGRTFALYGIHPWKPYPLRLYRSAYRERALLLEWLREERLPAVIAGDCNASPRSAFVVRLRELGYQLAAEAAGGRAARTWPMDRPWLAPFRVAIDHVLHTAPFATVAFRRGDASQSDHAPVVASLVWRAD